MKSLHLAWLEQTLWHWGWVDGLYFAMCSVLMMHSLNESWWLSLKELLYAHSYCFWWVGLSYRMMPIQPQHCLDQVWWELNSVELSELQGSWERLGQPQWCWLALLWTKICPCWDEVLLSVGLGVERAFPGLWWWEGGHLWVTSRLHHHLWEISYKTPNNGSISYMPVVMGFESELVHKCTI